MKLNNLFKYFSFYTLILGFFLFSSVNILWAANEKKINVKIACVAFYNQKICLIPLTMRMLMITNLLPMARIVGIQ